MAGSTNGDDTLVGTSGSDEIDAKQGDDSIDGLGGDDTLVGGQGDDTVSGGDGNDIISGDQGDDSLSGGLGDDTIYGGEGADTIDGGLGNDVMYGGQGNAVDQFVFHFVNFHIETTTSEVLTELKFRDGNHPAAVADAVAWNNYLNQLATWRAELIAANGADLDAGLDDTAYLTTSTKKGGTILLGSQSYDNDYQYWATNTTTVATVEGEGDDVVYQWGFAGGDDVLVLNGLSGDSTSTHYYGNFLSSSVVDGNTIIAINGGGSITLVGVSTTIDDLVAAGQVTF